MPAFSTIALASIAAAGIGTSVAQGEQSRRAGKRALRDQASAQRSALDQAQSERLRADQAARAANRANPDPTALLQAEQDALGRGPGTSLSGAGGVDPSRLKLGRQTLLGG
jgi:type II secretory pathway pseudopilin PulG